MHAKFAMGLASLAVASAAARSPSAAARSPSAAARSPSVRSLAVAVCELSCTSGSGWFDADPLQAEPQPMTNHTCRVRAAAWATHCCPKKQSQCGLPFSRLVHLTRARTPARVGNLSVRSYLDHQPPPPPPITSHLPTLHTIVIKGPLQPFTRMLLQYYLENAISTVVFSHNTGGCLDATTVEFLVLLRERFPHSFDFVLKPPPPRLGVGFRNAQREACYFGVEHAMTRFRPTYVLLHRPDNGFIAENRSEHFMSRLVALEQAQPPVDRAPESAPPGRRLGFCGNQIMFTDYYGGYHLDDHCMFGRAQVVRDFWSVDAPSYLRDRPASTSLPPHIRARRAECLLPGTESENGQLWVRLLEAEAGSTWKAPHSTLALLRSHVCSGSRTRLHSCPASPCATGVIACTRLPACQPAPR